MTASQKMTSWTRTAATLAALAGLAAATAAVAAPPVKTTTTTTTTTADDPAALLARARDALGMATLDAGARLHYRAVAAWDQAYQSDRMYPPSFAAMLSKEAWLDPQGGVLRVSAATTFPGSDGGPPQVTLGDGSHAFAVAGSELHPLPLAAVAARYLDPWAVIADWLAAGDVRVVGRAPYRDYVRVVLARATAGGEQRLFLDPKSGFPVKLEYDESHYLWGQRHIEYVYSNWTLVGGVHVPGSRFRLADGAVDLAETVGHVERVARAQAPSLALPADAAPAADTPPRFLQPLDLTITPIGPKSYLLSNPGYTEAVTEVDGEVFLFDATQGEGRARKDAAAIAKLFPAAKKVTVVVTDLAWPHVAGVRYWVASGATIIAHTAARAFLQRVVDRRWTRAPDLLEQRRAKARLRFVGVDAAHALGGGAVSLHPIDGIASEVALIAYFQSDRFLWASDYIQSLEPSQYASEVWRAAARDRLEPLHVAAEHLPLTPWQKIAAFAAGQ